VDIFYDQRGHLGCGVITFHTFEDAEAFEHSFKLAHCGREDYVRDLRLNNLGARLYGWHATEEVCTSPCHLFWCSGWVFSKSHEEVDKSVLVLYKNEVYRGNRCFGCMDLCPPLPFSLCKSLIVMLLEQ